jgi:putative peptidoglycan lipid II flippase
VSWLSYAFRFMQLPLGLFGVALGSATLPAVARSAAEGRMDDFRRILSRSLGMVFLLTIPSSVGLAVLGPAMIGAIYEGGSFDLYDTRQTGQALAGFAIGLAGYSAVKLLTPAFYALKDSRTPMLISALSVAVNYGTAWALLRFAHLGHEGLALSTSAVALFSFVAQFLAMRAKIGGVEGRALRRSILQIGTASMGMGLAVWAVSRLLQRSLAPSRWAYLAELAACIPMGVAVFYLICRALRVPELELGMKSIAGPLRRLIDRPRATIGSNDSRG